MYWLIYVAFGRFAPARALFWSSSGEGFSCFGSFPWFTACMASFLKSDTQCFKSPDSMAQFALICLPCCVPRDDAFLSFVLLDVCMRGLVHS